MFGSSVGPRKSFISRIREITRNNKQNVVNLVGISLVVYGIAYMVGRKKTMEIMEVRNKELQKRNDKVKDHLLDTLWLEKIEREVISASNTEGSLLQKLLIQKFYSSEEEERQEIDVSIEKVTENKNKVIITQTENNKQPGRML